MRIRSFEHEGLSFTILFNEEYIRYAKLYSLPQDVETRFSEIVVLAGKMPSWYAEGLIAYLAREHPEIRVFGIYRPPAKKILIVYSEDEKVPVGTWIEPSKRMLSFLETGE